MNLQGVLVMDLLGVAFILWIVNLVRLKRLHTGYAILWLSACVAVIVLVSVPPLLQLVTRTVGALFPASALSLIAFAFVFAVLILFSMQLSSMRDRQTRLAQSFALSKLEKPSRESETASSSDSGGSECQDEGRGGENDPRPPVGLDKL
jgi:hypothetical protein